MCGIVGYVGKRQAYPILIKGLHRLEYRGYDSAGVALVGSEGALNIYKCRGKVENLERFVASQNSEGTMGIAHTRWATHGKPNDVNAHPHYSESEHIALVHNGIIENYRALKDALIAKGYTFRSTTDSEVLVNLIEYLRITNHCSLLEAVQLSLKQVVGAYAIAVIERGNSDEMIAARKSSPMVIGLGEGEFFLGSDAASIIEYTHNFVYVDDGEVAIINRKAPLRIVTLDNKECIIEIKQLEMSISQLEKGGYSHFMLKEINEQPETIVACLRGRVNADNYEVKLSGVTDNREKFLHAKRIIMVACGTSWHASLIGEHLIEDICRIPVEVEYASEFRYRNPIIYEDDIVIAISQSGETADTLAAVELARSAGAFVFSICNVVGSSISRVADSGAYIHVGAEIGVASTKAFTGQVCVMALLALAVGRERGTVSDDYYREVVRGLLSLPEVLREVIKTDEQMCELSKIFCDARNFIYLGRGYNYPTALEGALKLK
ncbi:MAG: glutamine--fructose-6-phosphate transaminase (isomerizing), partial [Alistipes sp.]